MTSTSYLLYRMNPPELVQQVFDDYGYVELEPLTTQTKKDKIIELWESGERRPLILSQKVSCTTSYIHEVINRHVRGKYEITI